MSTQPQELPKVSPQMLVDPENSNVANICTDKSVCATEASSTSLLDQPWRITILPEPPKLPPGVLPAPEPHVAKSLPWRRGDVARLKDDSPEGMMRYIAVHTSGWWQELAERALRDNDKAERMAREAGWQPGQYWSLEVDAEARQKLLDAEEAKRQREEAERVKEATEKEAFMQRQMELLKKAGRAPRCEFLYTDGRGCRAPQVKGERWCHGHARMMSYRPEKLELEPMEDERAVMVNLYRVTKSLLAGRISEKMAGLMLWSVAIGMPGARRLRKPAQPQRTRRKNLPRINTDERGSEKKVSRESMRMKRKKTHHGDTEARRKRKNNLPQMNAEKRRSKTNVSRELTQVNTDQEGAFRATQILQSRQKRPLLQDDNSKCADVGARDLPNPGVTSDKSFNSGVDGGVPQGARDIGSSEGRVIGKAN